MTENTKSKIACVFLGLLLVLGFFHFINKAFHFRPWDYSINWTAATALRENVPLYEEIQLRRW